MPSDSPSQGGRRHFHRGRRGHDRRGGDRRGYPQQQAPSNQPPRGDHVDVEQIMREIRSRIAQRHGVELTDQQIQELAARRLESILDPRTVKPSLLDQLRRSAGARPDTVAAADRATAPYEFEDTTIYDSPSALTRFLRKLLNPILKLFFNPNPLIRALHIQAGLNAEAARREAERDERQAEWNGLHYTILHRIVTETAKVSLEVQNLSLKVESLSAKVDFNERRVRGIEGLAQHTRPGGGRDREREREGPAPFQPTTAPPAEAGAIPATVPGTESAPGEGRRRRRRRRGRRGGGMGEMAVPVPPSIAAGSEPLEADEIEEPESDLNGSADVVSTGTEAIEQVEEEDHALTVVGAAPEHVTPQLSTPEPSVREEAAPEIPATPAMSSEAEPDEPQ